MLKIASIIPVAFYRQFIIFIFGIESMARQSPDFYAAIHNNGP
jgi:hypothetical protein